MARGPCTFKQRNVTRALRATVAAGFDVRRVEIDPAGKIVLVTARSDNPDNEVHGELNDWADAK